MAKKRSRKVVETLTHEEASRMNIPTAEHETVMEDHDRTPIKVAYKQRNRDLDPQLVWRGKDLEDWSDLVVQAPPLFIQEKVHPKVLIDDLLRHSRDDEAAKADGKSGYQPDLFADFNGLPDDDTRAEFYQHDANWSNRMILGDSLQVMASLAEREGLRGKVQCIYVDPPYGIKFNSNFQWSTTSRLVKDGDSKHITREPEQVKAFRDTWRDGIHSYLTYLRDRLTVARDLLTDNGSIFVQIGDENVHRIRALMDEVFGDDNFISLISYRSSVPLGATFIPGIMTYIIMYAKQRHSLKFRRLFSERDAREETRYSFVERRIGEYRRITTNERREITKISKKNRLFVAENLNSAGRTESCIFPVVFQDRQYWPTRGKSWKTNRDGMTRLILAGRVLSPGNNLNYKLYLDDYPVREFTDVWMDTQGAVNKTYVVQSPIKVIQRCILMSTDPGDLVLDPTCGSGTTAYIAEQWGRRWITIDTSRVALALARTRIMGARYFYYILADSPEGQRKQGEITGSTPSKKPTYGKISQGFVYERVPHITLKAVANNAEIDIIWEKYQTRLESHRRQLNRALKRMWQPWEIPREAKDNWSSGVRNLHSEWWELRIACQNEMDSSISARAKFEYLYDKPFEDRGKVRVSGPFTVESISPHRVLGVDEDDELLEGIAQSARDDGQKPDFASMVLDHLRTSPVQQAHKADRLSFFSVKPWPGDLVCAEGRYVEGREGRGAEKRCGIFVGPEFGTVSRPDLVEAAREAAEAGFEVLVVCSFSYDARASDFKRLGRIPVLKARMNADLHMADDLKNTGKGNLFVIFGEPDIDILPAGRSGNGSDQIKVKINGVDVFHPSTGEVRSHNSDGIACWFVDTDYDQESFFVRHAYFLGRGDPYKALKTTLKAEINREAWSTLRSVTSRPFVKPQSGRIAVKVINHLGDEVMKVFKV